MIMKIRAVLLLTLTALCFSLTACGTEKSEELLTEAVTAEASEVIMPGTTAKTTAENKAETSLAEKAEGMGTEAPAETEAPSAASEALSAATQKTEASITEKAEGMSTEATAGTEASSAAKAFSLKAQKTGNTYIGSINYKLPDRKFLRECFRSKNGEIIISVDKNGDWSLCDENKFYEIQLYYYISEDYYNSESTGYDSYEEYRKALLDWYGLEEFDENNIFSEPVLYFGISGSVRNEDGGDSDYTEEDIFIRAVEYALYKPIEDSALAKRMAEKLSAENYCWATIGYEYVGNNVLAVYTDNFGDENENSDGRYYISASGEDGIILGNTFVPENTEVLCISGREKYILDMLADYLPEDCLVACAYDSDYYGGGEDVVFDIAEIAENLPKLKKLYIHQAALKNEEKITLITGLETLSYWHSEYTDSGYIETLDDAPFKGMTNLKELRLYGNYDSYDFLADMTSLESVYMEAQGNDRKRLAQIFACPYITELKLSSASDLSGIEKLENLETLEIIGNNVDLAPLKHLPALKELDIDADVYDLAPLGEIKSLESLRIVADGKVKSIASLTKLTKLKNLSMSGVTLFSAEEWGFLKNMKSVECLSISYSSNEFADALGEMTWLKDLSLIDITRNYDMSFFTGLTSLESVFLMGNTIDISEISKAKNLKSVSIWLSWFDSLSELGKCKSLDSLNIYNNNSSFDCKWLEGMKLKTLNISDGAACGVENMEALGTIRGLEALSLDFTGVSDETAEKIKEDLPECEIEVYELSGSRKF